MASIEQLLYEDAIRRQMDGERYINGLILRSRKLFRDQDVGHLDAIGAAILRLSLKDRTRLGDGTNRLGQTQRLSALREALVLFSKDSASLARKVNGELAAFGYDEAEYWTDRLNFRYRDEGLKFETPRKREFNEVWGKFLVLGTTMHQAMDAWASWRATLLEREIKQKFFEGLAPQAVMQEITRPNGVIMSSVSGNASDLKSKIVTHSTASVSAGQVSLQQKNKLIRDLVWISILDSVTSSTCWRRHGRLVNKQLDGRLPPAHPYCRSRTFPTARFERGDMFRESSKDWFNRQPEGVQKEIIGPGRFELYKTGKYSWPEDFIDDQSEQLFTLNVLRQRRRKN